MASPPFPYVQQLVDARDTIINIAHDQHNYVSHTTINPATTLNVLPYAEGASWNSELVCLRDTRRELLDEIWKWIYSADETKTAEILWLCDVAGTGKSAIAHTVARDCSNAGILASSFFFDRNIPDRRSPLKLFSTIARDLIRLSQDHVGLLCRILENDRSIASAGQSRQFSELILEPVRRHRMSGPVVIVIDALDEGCDRETLSILRNHVPKLPGTFRIIVTSRPTDDIRTDLLNTGHVQCTSLDIHGSTNQRDIALYIRDRLHCISSRRQLGADWPGEQRVHDFTQRAEGLFIWASTVSEYLLCAAYPDRKLSTLLYERNMSCLRAEAKMGVLYAEVVDACDWSDPDFVHDYKLVIGTIMAVKTPVSSSALQSLHRDHPPEVKEVLHPLSSLLTGVLNDGHPIQFIHLSFRDFLAHHAQFSSVHERFQVNEREHSQRLALLCLRVLNEDLAFDIPGIGYLTAPGPETKGIPPLDESQISEVLWYACRFWAEHIEEVEGTMSEAFLCPLRQFLTEKVIVWMEVLISKYSFQSLYGVRKWLQRIFPSEPALLIAISGSEYARILFGLSKHLSKHGRLEEALEAIMESVDICRQLAADRSTAHNADLARSLNKLSPRLWRLGHREDALKAALELVDIRRQLASDCPAAFNLDLANSLSNLSVCLWGLGRREDALEAILESVNLHRKLAADRPAVFKADLAHSLNTLSICLSDLGRQEGALNTILEAVDLHRRLATDSPAAFSADLARSLYNLSSCLSDLGRHRDSLEAILESVDLHRRLAADRPAAFNTILASSLRQLSNCLSDLGHRHDSLEAILETVNLRRRLAVDRPAVFNLVLARSLHSLSGRLLDLGRKEDALQAIQEAVDLRRRLAADHTTASNAFLASSLRRLSKCLSDLGRHEDASEATREAAEIC